MRWADGIGSGAWTAALLLSVAAAGVALIYAPIALLAVGALVLIALFTVWPRLALAVWLLTLIAVPEWLGLDVGIFLAPATLVGVMCLPACFVRLKWRTGAGDSAALGFIVLVTVVYFLGGGTDSAWGIAVSLWAVAYIMGRGLAARAGVRWAADFFGWLMVAIAALSICEFAFEWHPFIDMVGPNAGENTWASLLYRGGLPRSEWAMGHPIALGAAISAAIPFVLTSRARGAVKFVGLAVLALGLAATISRGPIIAGVFTLLLTVYALRERVPRRQRTLAVSSIVAVAALLAPVWQEVSTSDARVLDASNAYRAEVLPSLLNDLTAFSTADNAVRTGGILIYQGFSSIDNTFLAVGIQFGYVAAALLLAVVAITLLRVLRRRATPADVVIAGQLPALLTVALITQYGPVMWFLAGLAVTWAQESAGASQDDGGERQVVGEGVADRRRPPVDPQLVVPA